MIDERFRWQFEHLAHSRSYRRKLVAVNAARPRDRRPLERPPLCLPGLLGAILLIEMHQRPGIVRFMEWIVSFTVPRRIRRPITRGPLQLADGPWNLEQAMQNGYAILARAVEGTASEATALQSAAVAWNGKAVRQPCSAYGYGDVLQFAYVIASRALVDQASDPRNARCGAARPTVD